MFRAFLAAVALAAAPAVRAHPEIEAALARLNAALAAAPHDAALYLARGELYAQHRDWLTAEANFLRAAELAPGLPRLDRARGALALAQHRPAEARAHLDRAVALAPDDAEARVLRCGALAALGERTAALADLEHALAALENPGPDLFLLRAALLADPAAAIRSLDAAIARIGSVPALEQRALELEVSSDQPDAALARLTRLAAAAERPEPWLKRRGDLLARLGRAAEARAAYAAALAALQRLPDWLRASPANAELAAELVRLSASVSNSS